MKKHTTQTQAGSERDAEVFTPTLRLTVVPLCFPEEDSFSVLGCVSSEGFFSFVHERIVLYRHSF